MESASTTIHWIAVIGLTITLGWCGSRAGIPEASPTTGVSEESEPAALEDVLDSCPVTVPGEDAFTPRLEAPDDPPSVYEAVWYGSPDLWTLVSLGGEVWRDLPRGRDGSLTQKTFWWSKNYTPEDPGRFVVTARNLSGSGTRIGLSRQGGRGHNPFMLAPTHRSVTVVGVALPAPGCWEITGEYNGVTLSYIAWASAR